MDPACGSGNFLTETYISLRRLENLVIRDILDCDRKQIDGQIVFGDVINPIKVGIEQFYGIEINDFAVTVGKTALWIAESQMMKETEDILAMSLDFLPLKTNANIHEGNALRMDWDNIVDRHELNYIMGNPPFIGHQWRNDSQKRDMEMVFDGYKTYGKLDYVAAWYKKSSDYMNTTSIKCAFVSTNSIVQGESVSTLWKPFLNSGKLTILFARQTFIWNSESNQKAHVHCVIIGFTCGINNSALKTLFIDDKAKEVENINGYLMDAPNIFIENRGLPLTPNMPKMSKGSQPTDGGNLILSSEEKEEITNRHPDADGIIKQYVSADDYINNKKRYCIWLKNVPPHKYTGIKPIMSRLDKVRDIRLKSPTKSVQEAAKTPTLFTQIRQPNTDYLAVPEVSSERRRYIPIGFMPPEVIASNKLYLIPNASLFLFGVLISNVHMAWMRVVAGRLEMRYSYSPSVYNNFPWPTPTDEQKAKIEQTAQAILDARALYPESSLADLYDPLTMPIELQKAHTANDKAVMQAYGFDIKSTTEADCVAKLMQMYKELTINDK